MSARAARDDRRRQEPTFLVTRIVDGGSVVREGIGTLRLIGVDTPEMVDPRRPVQRFGSEATAFTRKLLAGQRVRIDYDAGSSLSNTPSSSSVMT